MFTKRFFSFNFVFFIFVRLFVLQMNKEYENEKKTLRRRIFYCLKTTANVNRHQKASGDKLIARPIYINFQ